MDKIGDSSLISKDPYPLFLVAMFDGDFSVDWIAEITREKFSEIIGVLDGAIRQGLLAQKGPGIYCFTDLKKQQKLRNHFPPEEKERIWRQIADLLFKEVPDPNDKALAIAPYLLHITNDVERCRWLIRAGDIYRRSFRNEEALQCYIKVLNDLSGLSGEEADITFCNAAINYSKISTAREDTKKVLAILKEAIPRVKRWNAKPLEALLDMNLARNEWLLSKHKSALKRFEKAWSVAKELDDPKLLRSATIFSTYFFFWQGRFLEAVRNYERSAPDIDKIPRGTFPLWAAVTVGRCYSYIGQITQGLGMLDTLQKHCQERGDRYLEAQTGISIGGILIDIRHVDEAIQHLENSVELAFKEHNDWIMIIGMLMLAYAYYLKGSYNQSNKLLRKFFEQYQRLHVTGQHSPYLMELCWAMEQGKLTKVPGLLLKKEIRRVLNGENIFMKGIGYRYLAFLQEKDGLPKDKIIHSLNLSLKWLEKSGHQIETARSQLEIARQCSLSGDEEKAKRTRFAASKILSSFNERLIPDDLQSLTRIRHRDPYLNKKLLKEILQLGREFGTIHDNKELVTNIISTANRITGAERGAIFLVEGGASPSLRLKASKNLTPEQINHPHFYSSMEMIKEVTAQGKGRIFSTLSVEEKSSAFGERILSRICVPMLLREKVIGVLYHDNLMLRSAFKQSDLELLSYFAAQAAIALDYARAYEEIQRLNQNLKEENLYYAEQHLQILHFENIVGDSPALKEVLAQIGQVAKTDATVLILGETGAGKELVARAIHRQSSRRDKPFIGVPCTALPDSLIPSELFGHEKGAFTGAIQRRIGRFELANKGTLFLDEIGDIPLDVQIRLLWALEHKEFQRVGGGETIYSDFRLIAATNRDLEQAVKAENFRSDLYYRLNVFPIYVPPLRERREDIPLLALYFLEIYAGKMGKAFQGIPESEMKKLLHYHWPGNVRELENIIERAIILSKEPNLYMPELGAPPPDEVVAPPPDLEEPKTVPTLKEIERGHILSTLQKVGWKVRGPGGASELLGIHPSTLNFRIKKLGIEKPPKISLEKIKMC
jgi:formate hydrogenlyase transcriptional activator